MNKSVDSLDTNWLSDDPEKNRSIDEQSSSPKTRKDNYCIASTLDHPADALPSTQKKDDKSTSSPESQPEFVGVGDAGQARKRKRPDNEDDGCNIVKKHHTSPLGQASNEDGLLMLYSRGSRLSKDNIGRNLDEPKQPGLYGTKSSPRLHPKWFEQWHEFGTDCELVHGDQSKKTHRLWLNVWDNYFGAEEAILRELGVFDEPFSVQEYDIRKGCLGMLMGFPLPRECGKLRWHPSTVARDKVRELEASRGY